MSTNCNKDECANNQEKFGTIAIKDFLQFLKLSVNVNNNLDSGSNSNTNSKSSKTPFNFDQLSKNELVNNLMRKYKNISETPSPTLTPATPSSAAAAVTTSIKVNDGANPNDELGKKIRKRSAKAGKNISLKSKVGESCENLFPNLNPSLTEKLEEVLNQGE
jgi:hypothetical protein